jgi:ankyrin repeat protein
MFAAKNNNIPIARKLLEKAPDLINKQNDEGNTALHLVVIDSNTAKDIGPAEKMVTLLLEFGAHTAIMNNNKKSAYGLANQSIKKIFESKKSKVAPIIPSAELCSVCRGARTAFK